MVDFSKKLTGKTVRKPIDPVKLYDTLDREADKGPLRPAQFNVLNQWYSEFQNTRDVIVKLHTGQGKTLTGLLMLQSRLNQGLGPVTYLCPNNFLVEQTCEQARQFGIASCVSDGELPDDFLSSKSILVTSAQKLFNGFSKFGLDHRSCVVNTVLLDDAHACSDIIRSQCRIRIPAEEPAYASLKALFCSELEAQGSGTFADIENGKRDAFLPVPYWAWIPRQSEIAGILSKHAERKSIKFAWPLLKDILDHCQCLFSGAAVEIEPYLAPLAAFGSYFRAAHRIFMSATVTDDAFLVKGLQLSPETIMHPITYAKETWSGEKMILVPSLISDTLDSSIIISEFSRPVSKRKSGRVALVTSVAKAGPWKTAGAKVSDTDTIVEDVQMLRKGECEKTLVLVNRYDGIDPPDNTCRVLTIDSRPYSESLVDLYEEQCRPNSAATLMRTVRSLEQGMGRSVRGEKDFCVIIVIGADLVRLLRDRKSRKYLSAQMATQIDIGLEITELARTDIYGGKSPYDAFIELANQCLLRNEDWKAFYVEKMAAVKPSAPSANVLQTYADELKAEISYSMGDYSTGAQTLQALLDTRIVEAEETGWYLQEQARFRWQTQRTESDVLQTAAYKKCRQLLRPPQGITIAKLTIISQGRAERVKAWLSQYSTYSELNVCVSEILGRLVFGVKADKFEAALNELSRALGFVGERPDAEWKEGPDNLWALDDRSYVIFECKNEVDIARAEINKRETEQMNRSSAWFAKHYPGMNVKRLIIHPAGKVESAASFTHSVEGIREPQLKRLVLSVHEFFKSFETQNLSDLSESNIQQLINSHHLSVHDLQTKYCCALRDVR